MPESRQVTDALVFAAMRPRCNFPLRPGAVEVFLQVEKSSARSVERHPGWSSSREQLISQPTAGRNIFIMGALAPTVLPTGNAVSFDQQDQSSGAGGSAACRHVLLFVRGIRGRSARARSHAAAGRARRLVISVSTASSSRAPPTMRESGEGHRDRDTPRGHDRSSSRPRADRGSPNSAD